MTLLSDPPVPPALAGPPGRPSAPSGMMPAAGPPRQARAPIDDRVSLVPSLLAVLALLAGSAALSSVLDEPTWVLPIVEVVGIVWLLGVGCRLLRSPAPVTVLVQFAGFLVVLTSLFTSSGIGGLIPTAAAFRDAGDLLRDAWAQILATVPPAPTTPALTFLAALALGTTALIVDFLVAEAKAPALVALPLLCLYSVPASISTQSLPWWTFVAPALLYAALLASTGSLLTRRLGRASVGLVVSGVLVAGVGAGAGVFGGDSITAVGTEGHLPRNSVGSGQIGLSPFTSLRGDLKRGEPVELLQIREQPVDDYLRVVALELWRSGQDAGFSYGALADDGDPRNGISATTPGDDPVEVTVESLRWADRWLPMFAGTQAIQGLGPDWQYDRALSTVYREQEQNPKSYRLLTSFEMPTAADLRTDTVTPTAELLDTTGIPDSVRNTAANVVAGQQTPFEKADALLKYFTTPANGFTYSLQVPPGSSGNQLADFLENKQGYCEQYASAMAAMLRTVGIPSRVAVGFTQGERKNDGTRVITTNDAHAWVEVRFDEHGWVRFDPTPLTGGTGRENGFTEGGTGPGTGETSSASETVGPSTEPSVDTTGGQEQGQGLDPDDGGTDTESTTAVQVAAPAAPTGLAAVPRWVWWGLGLVVLLAVLAMVPGLIRGQRRRSRLQVASSGGPGAATAAWAEIEDLMLDHRMALIPTESTRTTANRVAKVAGLNQVGRTQLRSLVIAAEQQWYADGHSSVAVAAPPQEDLAPAIQAVRSGLTQAIPLRAAERWIPRSLRPRV